MTSKEVLNHISEFELPNVVITGCEPLIQQEHLVPLTTKLKEMKFRCEIETNGTFAPEAQMIDTISQWNVSPKTANSHNTRIKREVKKALETFSKLDNAYFKFVVSKLEDVDDVVNLVSAYSIPDNRVILMPEGTNPNVIHQKGLWLAEICKTKNLRFTTRLHILMWGNERGK